MRYSGDGVNYSILAGVALVAFGVPVAARASDTPLYQPAPTWIAPPPATTPPGPDSPPLVMLDLQHRIEGGQVWSYVHQQLRMVSPEMLAQAATLTFPWAPDKGDLIVHDLAIVRGGQRIDLIAKGQRFTVLRREQALEQRELTGILTATMAVEGLEVGDILDMRLSITSRDAALGGRVQDVTSLIAEPARIGPSRVRFSWPTADAPRWKLLADGVVTAPARNGAYTELTIALPVAKPKDMPQDAPSRFNHPPMIEVASFDGWADVSKVMAPLYATTGLIAADSGLVAEVAAIRAADTTPIGRAQRALESVQNKIRYLAVGMDGGNYVPQSPARTWQVRYGDCKAKTLLLLAMLREMGIEAEPVLAHVGLGDLVPQRLPSAAAFNHVFVRAVIDGETLWLDGTGSDARLADIRNTPGVGYVLPVRTAGAQPVRIETHADARPIIDMTVEADESTSVDLPSAVAVTAVLHGQMAAMMRAARTQLNEKQQREMASEFLSGWVGNGFFTGIAITPDAATGDVVLKATGLVDGAWSVEDRRKRRPLQHTLDQVSFTPDRSRPEWTQIPVAAKPPAGLRYRTLLRLPDAGRNFTLDGAPDLDATLAGVAVKRTTRVTDGVVTVDERIDALGMEVPAARIATERDALATAKARAPRMVAPADIPAYYLLTPAQIDQSSQIRVIRNTYGQAIALDPDQPAAYLGRAAFEQTLGNRRAAMTDLNKVVSTQPSVDVYLQRSALSGDLNDLPGALADAERARALDPSSFPATSQVAASKAETGDLSGAVALLDERIALGGETRSAYRQAKAALMGEFGDPAAAIAMLDTLIVEKPGSPGLLNARCWVKGTRSVMLDTALKDCTNAIELSDNTLAALDSRAMVWFRMGRFTEAMADLDAVLAAEPTMAGSHYLRSAVLKAMHRDPEAIRELAIARRLQPASEREYARYGIKF